MFYLIATLLLNVLISAMFKVFPKYDINALQAIVTNYCVCVITGSLFIGKIPFTVDNLSASWFPWSMLMGLGFISIFNLIAYCTKIDGITTATIANKLSLVIPVVFAVFLYNEKAGIVKITGILLALPAVYLTTRIKEDHNKPQNLFWPALLFIGGGLLDTLTNYIQKNYLLSNDSQALCTIYCFSTAGTIGLIIVTILLIMKKITFSWKNVIAGICVGVPNYFSIYYFIKMLNSPFLQTSASLPILNINILLLSSIVAILLFKEKSNLLRITGLILSIIAIILIAYGDK